MLLAASFEQVMTTIGYVLLALCALMFMVVINQRIRHRFRSRYFQAYQ